MVIGWVFALAATVLNSVAGLLESDATRHASRDRWLVTRPRYLGGLPAHAHRLVRAQWLRAAKRGYPKLFSGSSFLLSPKSMTIWVGGSSVSRTGGPYGSGPYRATLARLPPEHSVSRRLCGSVVSSPLGDCDSPAWERGEARPGQARPDYCHFELLR